jgi:hypothetical protein
MKRADATRADLFCLDDMRLDALLPAAHGGMLALPDRPIVADRTSISKFAAIVPARPRPNLQRTRMLKSL